MFDDSDFGRPASPMTATRRWLAARLRRLAQRLDPAPVVVRTAHGWTITMVGVPLAVIRSADIVDERPALPATDPNPPSTG